MLEYSVTAQIDQAGLLHQTTRVVTKVLRVQGIESAQAVSLSWSPAREDRPAIKARVITTDGEPHLLDANSIAERDSDNPSAVGIIKTLSATLPQVDIDSVVELEFAQSAKIAAVPGATLGVIVLRPGPPIVHFKAAIGSVGPSSLRVEARSFPQAKVTQQPAPQGHAVSVEASSFEPRPVGNFLPPEIAPTPEIVFTNVPSWQAVVQWYSGVIAKSITAQVDAHAPSGEAVAAIENIYEDMRKHVQNNGLDLGTGSLVPSAPGETWKRGEADSKDQAALLVSKLAAVGIPAKFALICAAPAAEVLPNAPGIEAFNRALVYVPPAPGKIANPLWIDPTAEFTATSALPIADQERWALIVDPSTTQLVRTPTSTAADNAETIDVQVRLGDGKPTKIVENLKASGAFQDALRPRIAQIVPGDEESKQRSLMPIFMGVGGQQIDTAKYPDSHSLLATAAIEIAGEGFSSSAVNDEGGSVDLPGPARLNFQRLASLFIAAPEDGMHVASTRSFDYYVPPPFASEDIYHVIPPPGYRLKEPPSSETINLGPLTISTTSKLENNGSLLFSEKLTSPKDRFSPQEVGNMRAAARQIAGKNAVRVQFENVAILKLQSGELAEALKLLRADAAASKDNVNPSLRLASGYVAVGARPAAARLCDGLLKQNSPGQDKPASDRAAPAEDTALADIYSRLGGVYEHDDFGQFFPVGGNATSGFDYEKAEKNLRKALDLDSGNIANVLHLANLYTYNPAGVHYGRGSRLDDAADLYRHLDLNAVARAGRLNEYGLLLLRARKYADLRELFLLPQGDQADQSIKWAGFAASRNDSDLKDEIQFRYSSPSDRHVILVIAARQLVAAREYAAAARVLRLAGPGAGVTSADIDRLSRLRVFDETSLSSQPAVAAFQRYVQSVLDPDKPEAWKQFVTPAQQKSPFADKRHRLLQMFGNLTATPANPSAWPYLSDIIDTALSLTYEGNGAAGFRIKASAVNGSASGAIGYVVKDGDSYLVAGLANTDAVFVQAAASARTGNAAAAKQWLDWGRQDAGLGKLADSEVQPAIDFVSARTLAANGHADQAIEILQRLHTQKPTAVGTTSLLAETLIQSNRISEASALIEAIEKSDPGGLVALRLRSHLLAQQGKYADAAAVAKQICANPKAAAV